MLRSLKNLFVSTLIITCISFSNTMTVLAIEGTETAKVPRNIDGNQGEEVYAARIFSVHEGKIFEVLVNSFNNNMTDVNIAVYIESERVSDGMHLSSGETLKFSIPPNTERSILKIIISSNTADENSTTFIEVRPI